MTPFSYNITIERGSRGLEIRTNDAVITDKRECVKNHLTKVAGVGECFKIACHSGCKNIHRLLFEVAVSLFLAHVKTGDEQYLGAVNDFEILNHVLELVVLLLHSEKAASEAVREQQIVVKEVLVDRL